jgi:hypothetical protein
MLSLLVKFKKEKFTKHCKSITTENAIYRLGQQYKGCGSIKNT